MECIQIFAVVNFAELIFVDLLIDLKFVELMRMVVKRELLAVGMIETGNKKIFFVL